MDAPLLKAAARARRWFDELVSGRAASMIEIGQREGVGKRYVSRMIRLAFLAPAIIESLVEGRQPPELTAQLLSTSGDLPLELARARTTARLRRSRLSALLPTKILPRFFQYLRLRVRLQQRIPPRPAQSAEVHRLNGQ